MPFFLCRIASMSAHALTALSPLDGRYASKAQALRPIFSEYGLMHRRVHVEIEWLLALAADPGIAELPAFMRPVAVARVAALPRDAAAGKVQRRLLAAAEVLEWVEL